MRHEKYRDAYPMSLYEKLERCNDGSLKNLIKVWSVVYSIVIVWFCVIYHVWNLMNKFRNGWWPNILLWNGKKWFCSFDYEYTIFLLSDSCKKVTKKLRVKLWLAENCTCKHIFFKCSEYEVIFACLQPIKHSKFVYSTFFRDFYTWVC